MLQPIDISIVVLTVIFACVLPYTHTTPTCRAVSRFFVCALVIALCVSLPPRTGVPLALLLVLASVPVIGGSTLPGRATDHLDHLDHLDHRAEHFKNAPEGRGTPGMLESFSLPKMNETAIQEKLSMYEKVRSKQHAFEKHMEKIDKNLKNVKEFYANNVKQSERTTLK